MGRAQKADGADDQTALVRIRKDGTDNLQLEIYRVDDLNGSIGGLAPGQAGYAAAAAARDYHTTSGGNDRRTGLRQLSAGATSWR